MLQSVYENETPVSVVIVLQEYSTFYFFLFLYKCLGYFRIKRTLILWANIQGGVPDCVAFIVQHLHDVSTSKAFIVSDLLQGCSNKAVTIMI